MNLEDDILIERFLKNELSAKERELFITRMDNDPHFKENVELEQQLFHSLNDEGWSYAKNTNHPEVKYYEEIFRDKETHQIKASISKAQTIYKNAKKTKQKPWFAYGVAAVIIFLVTLYISLPTSSNHQELYETYLEDTNLLALVDRGNSNQLSQAQSYFDAKNYKKSAFFLSQILDTTKNANVYFYLSISQMELKEYDAAERTLSKLTNSNLLDATKGYWYKSLLYLKSEQFTKLKTELNRIISNSYYKKEKAQELLKKIQ